MLTSIWEQNDPELLQELIKLHWRNPHKPRIFDLTFGRASMWRGFERPLGLDINPVRRPPIIGTYEQLPLRNNCIDILVYDPPHIPDAGRKRPKMMDERYSIRWGKHSIEAEFPIVLKEAARVLTPNGFLVAKLSDQIQLMRKHWQVFAFFNACIAVGLIPCDTVIKVRKAPMVQPWSEEHQKHSWQRHSQFLVIKKQTC